MCDTYNACKELLRHKNYRLEEMAQTQLGITRPDLPMDDVSTHIYMCVYESFAHYQMVIQEGDLSMYFSSSEKLQVLVKHCGNDSYLAMSLVFKLNYIPLTKSLTCVCGNLWYGLTYLSLLQAFI